MKNDFKFSVLMTVYINDTYSYFKKALDSILNQTLLPDEIIILCDGEVSLEILQFLKKIKEDNPQLYTIKFFEKNRGLGLVLRDGVCIARNEIIARMDSDDICLNTRFEKQVSCFKTNSKLDIVGGQISEFIDSEDNIVSHRIVPLKHEEISEYIKYRCPFNHVTVMFKKQSVLKVGNYIDFFFNEDYILWIKMYEKNLVMQNIDEVLVNVRIGVDMYKRRGGLKYYKSEYRVQKYMYSKNIINFYTFIQNVIKRFIIQVLVPASLREYIYIKLARTGVDRHK